MQTEITRMLSDYEGGRLSRRQLIATLSGLAAAAAAVPARGQSKEKPAGSTFLSTDVNHLALRVTDLERSAEFYQRHLGLEITSRGRWNCFLRRRENNFLALFKSDKAAMDHYCFSVREYDAGGAVERLKAAGLKPRRQENRVYFDDPDGLEVQVAAKSHGA